MTTPPLPHPLPPCTSGGDMVETPAELLLQALQTVLPTAFLDLLLDRIEAAR